MLAPAIPVNYQRPTTFRQARSGTLHLLGVLEEERPGDHVDTSHLMQLTQTHRALLGLGQIVPWFSATNIRRSPLCPARGTS